MGVAFVSLVCSVSSAFVQITDSFCKYLWLSFYLYLYLCYHQPSILFTFLWLFSFYILFLCLSLSLSLPSFIIFYYSSTLCCFSFLCYCSMHCFHNMATTALTPTTTTKIYNFLSCLIMSNRQPVKSVRLAVTKKKEEKKETFFQHFHFLFVIIIITSTIISHKYMHIDKQTNRKYA